MSGGPDPLYVRARTALLDAADALVEQLDALVLVGAQAIYLHTGRADFRALVADLLAAISRTGMANQSAFAGSAITSDAGMKGARR